MAYDVRPAERRDRGLFGHERAAAPGFVLVAGEPAVGFVHVVEAERAAHLDELLVLDEYRGQGIGSALLGGAVRTAAQRGHARLSLCAYAQTAPFFEPLGFVVTTTLTAYLRRLVEMEESLGLSRHGPRVVMVARLEGSRP